MDSPVQVAGLFTGYTPNSSKPSKPKKENKKIDTKFIDILNDIFGVN